MSFVIVNQLSSSQIDELLELFRHTYWANDRKRSDVVRMLANTDLVFGLYDEEAGRLCAFARVLSDGVYRAVLFDVVVHPKYQGKGLARELMEAIVSHPSLAKVEKLILYCRPEVVELYKKWGFTEELGDTRMMMRSTSEE